MTLQTPSEFATTLSTTLAVEARKELLAQHIEALQKIEGQCCTELPTRAAYQQKMVAGDTTVSISTVIEVIKGANKDA